ncbi:hypothetical protein MY3957_004469 [Beauveria namnaoensis]
MATNGDDEDDDNIVRIKPWEPNAFTLIEMPGAKKAQKSSEWAFLSRAFCCADLAMGSTGAQAGLSGPVFKGVTLYCSNTIIYPVTDMAREAFAPHCDVTI